MSVVLLFTREEGGSDDLVPIATEYVFLALWDPVIRRLQLEWMPLFQTGFSVDPADLPAVIAEVEQFVVQVRKMLGDERYQSVLTRAETLLESLRDLQASGFADLFTG